MLEETAGATEAPAAQSEPIEVEPPVEQDRVLDLSEEPEGEEAEAPKAEPEHKESAYRQKKGARYADMKRRADESTRQAEDYRRQLDEQRTQYAEMQRLIAASLQGRQQQQEAPKPNADLARITEQMDYQLQVAASESTPPELGKKAMAMYRQLEEERLRLLVKEMAPAPAQHAPQVDPNAAAARAILSVDFPWIENNKEATDEAIATYNYLRAAEGRPASLATEREACARVAARRGLGGNASPPPSEERRQRYNGVPTRQTAARGNKVTLTSEERKWISEAGLDERKYAQEVAKTDPSRLHE